MDKVAVLSKAVLTVSVMIIFLGSVRSQEVIHTSKNGVYYSESTELSIKQIINNPKAIVLAFPTEETKKILPSPLGISNNGVNWYIFRQDRQPIPDSAKFRVLYTESATEKQFLYVINEKTIKDNIAYLDHPTLNNNSNQQILGIATHNPTGVYNNAFIDFAYDEKQKMWYVFNTNKKPIPKDLGIYMIITEKAVARAPKDLTPAPVSQPVPVKGTPPGTITKGVAQPVLEVTNPRAMVSQVMFDVDFPNWDFESGLTGWTATGTAFMNQPAASYNVVTNRVLTNMEYRNNGVGGNYWKEMTYPIGNKGRFWIGTYEKNNGTTGSTFGATQGDDPMGMLVSPEFIITQKYCYFLIGGGSNANQLKVELQIKQPDSNWRTEAFKTPFRNSELLYRENFSLTSLKGQIARIRIIDNTSGNWGHINADDFRFTDSTMNGIMLTDGATNRQYMVDVDCPVWGFADTHAHPAHDDGFGGRLILGKANDPLSVTYSSAVCKEIHGGGGLLNTPFIGGADVHPIMEGWPDFIGFPRFNSKTHQQQHVEFLKRAWQGGLRLISALAVNNMYMPALFLGPGHTNLPYDDDATVIRQIQDIKNIAASQSSWMEIAYTPKDARRIILQGKCAVVIGVEVDNFGNFKVPSYTWDDNVYPANHKLVSLTPENANQQITDKVNQYFNLGVRQVTPIHYLSGTFGGAAVFRGELALVQFKFNKNITVKNGASRNIFYSLKPDTNFPMVLAGVTGIGYEDNIIGLNPYSTMNTMLMTDFGRTLMNKLMDKGIIMDSEHMGYDTKDDFFALAKLRNYPVMSSHTDPSGLSFGWVKGQASFVGTPEDLVNNFGTTNIRNLANEFNMADDHYDKIRASGGTVGVFMLPYVKKPYQGFWGSVANDCAGSSKTFAQMYLYSLDKMDGHSVAISTDRGMTDFIAPRFGPNSAYTLRYETYAGIKFNARKIQRLAQRNGVKYDRPMGSFHISWYHQDDAGAIDENENDAWIAFAALEANVAEGSIPDSKYVLHGKRIYNYAKGYRARSESVLEAPSLLNGDTPWEQAVMYCLNRNINPTQLSRFAGLNQDQKNRLNAIYNAVLPAWQTWKAKYGNNEPLRRYRTGNRDWDFNTDGMAHYGLMPDFLQDLTNIGLSKDAMAPLFKSAEDYIRMWEKSVKSSGSPN